MRAVFVHMEQAYQQAFIGKKLQVLWERALALGPGSWQLSGLSDNYLRVSGLAPHSTWNRIESVQITARGRPRIGGRAAA